MAMKLGVRCRLYPPPPPPPTEREARRRDQERCRSGARLGALASGRDSPGARGRLRVLREERAPPVRGDGNLPACLRGGALRGFALAAPGDGDSSLCASHSGHSGIESSLPTRAQKGTFAKASLIHTPPPNSSACPETAEPTPHLREEARASLWKFGPLASPVWWRQRRRPL